MRTDALPFFYIPEQFAARLPDVFLLLLAIAVVGGVIDIGAGCPRSGGSLPCDRRRPAGERWRCAMARRRGILIVIAAVSFRSDF